MPPVNPNDSEAAILRRTPVIPEVRQRMVQSSYITAEEASEYLQNYPPEHTNCRLSSDENQESSYPSRSPNWLDAYEDYFHQPLSGIKSENHERQRGGRFQQPFKAFGFFNHCEIGRMRIFWDKSGIQQDQRTQWDLDIKKAFTKELAEMDAITDEYRKKAGLPLAVQWKSDSVEEKVAVKTCQENFDGYGWTPPAQPRMEHHFSFKVRRGFLAEICFVLPNGQILDLSQANITLTSILENGDTFRKYRYQNCIIEITETDHY